MQLTITVCQHDAGFSVVVTDHNNNGSTLERHYPHGYTPSVAVGEMVHFATVEGVG